MSFHFLFLGENTLCQVFPTFLLHILKRLPTGETPLRLQRPWIVTFNSVLPEGLALGRDGREYSQIRTFLFCLQRCYLVQQLLSSYSLVLLVLPSCIKIKMISVTASLSLIKRYKYLCLNGQGQKSKNEAWGKDGLKSDQFAVCVLPRNRNKKNYIHARLATHYICDYFPQFSLICMYISYMNQQMTKFLKQVHIFNGKAPYSYLPMYFFCLFEQSKNVNNETDKRTS